jgi:hypothetical protein
MGMLIGAVIAAGVLGSLTDWLFMGVLFHSAYNTFPEIWKPGIRDGNEKSAIIWASLIGLVMAAAVIALCAIVGVGDVMGGLGIALLVWIAGPLPVLVINGFFVKIDPRITFSHCLGYLVRLLIAGAAAGVALPLS